MWIPSPPQRVIGPAAYYPLEGGGVMKEPPPSLVVAGLTNYEHYEFNFQEELLSYCQSRNQ